MDKLPPLPKGKPGRPEGSMNKLAREARAKAVATGALPHEIMLDIARGNPQKEKLVHPQTGEIVETVVSVPLEMRLDAAKAAAPYYAPKISTVEVLAGASENELDRLIAVLAAEAGVSLGHGSEGEDGEATGGEGEGVGGEAAEHIAGRAVVLRRRTVTGT